jgi:type II secretory pathway pseudopilin PulG
MDLVPLLSVTIVLVVLGLAAVLAVAVAGRRRLERQLQSARADLGVLQDRLDALARSLPSPAVAGGPPARAQYLITSLADEPEAPDGVPGLAAPPAGHDLVTLALAESTIRLAALAHGVRRALSPENRNRIRFEMGREVKRSRRQRRRDVKEAKRHLRAHPDLSEDAA